MGQLKGASDARDDATRSELGHDLASAHSCGPELANGGDDGLLVFVAFETHAVSGEAVSVRNEATELLTTRPLCREGRAGECLVVCQIEIVNFPVTFIAKRNNFGSTPNARNDVMEMIGRLATLKACHPTMILIGFPARLSPGVGT